MASFDPEVLSSNPLDFQLWGGPVLFRAPSVLDAATASLEEAGYRVVSLDAGLWSEPGVMHDAFARSLDFPDYYGRNLDALNDCMRGVGAGYHGVRPSDTGLVLVMKRYDEFARFDAAAAHHVLDIVVGQASAAMAFGHRILVLLQVSDSRFEAPTVGGVAARWNPDEWLDVARGL